MMEVLQISKFAHKANRLDFCNDWVANKDMLREIKTADIDHDTLVGLLENHKL
jgi:hypothetical protein